MNEVRTRIAPSPTGYVHIGTLHTALFNYFFARQNKGKFIIRIEDTDRERFVEGATENLLGVFNALKIEHDEGPFLEDGKMIQRGDVGPYIQSERLGTYKKYVDQLLAQGDAYHCFCSKERLEEMRSAQQATKQTPKYDRRCASLTPDEVQQKISAGEPFVIRMKVPEGETIIEDEIRGTIKFNNADIDDQVILKSDGFPTYHMAVVVDDSLMNITHIIRGEEWLPSAPKHVMLYKMLGLAVPVFAHLPLLLNPDRSKLSKRQGDVSVEDYLKKGYLRDALLNFVGTLGFNPSGEKEIFTLQELIDAFDLKRVNKSSAILNKEKLDWMNNQYLQKMTFDEFKAAAKDFVTGDETMWKAAFIERGRVNRLDELQAKLSAYETNSDYDASLLVWKKSDAADAKLQLENIKAQLDSVSFDDLAGIEDSIRSYMTAGGLQAGNVLWPLRVALSGQEKSASPFELLWVLGKDESLNRIEVALQKLV
ncbi:MAG: glutamate--tRNA ligase [Patescibacteria group bacterium]